MNAPAALKPDFTAIIPWANRIDAYRGSAWQTECLESVRDEARAVDDLAFYWAAQGAIDGDWSDLDWLIREADEAERLANEPEESPRAWFDASARHPDAGGW